MKSSVNIIVKIYNNVYTAFLSLICLASKLRPKLIKQIDPAGASTVPSADTVQSGWSLPWMQTYGHPIDGQAVDQVTTLILLLWHNSYSTRKPILR
jgi:hypothetical protein